MANILVVDDNIAFLEIQTEYLRRAGHEVTPATNGIEAMNRVDSQRFDLVITDLIMPDKEGVQVIMELRKKHPGIRIIAMSGGGRVNAEDYLAIARRLGATKTLSKPFTGEELLGAVSEVMANPA